MLAKIKALLALSLTAIALGGCATVSETRPFTHLQPLPTTLEAARADFPKEEWLTYFYYNEADYRKEVLQGCHLRSIGSHRFSSTVSSFFFHTEIPTFKDNQLVAIAPLSMAKITIVPDCVVQPKPSRYPRQDLIQSQYPHTRKMAPR